MRRVALVIAVVTGCNDQPAPPVDSGPDDVVEAGPPDVAPVEAGRQIDVAAIASDADWILGAITPDGAICTYPDKTFISPYMANYAAVGLARAFQATTQKKYADAAFAYLTWYANHAAADPNGYVEDQNVPSDGGTETPTGSYDSTDAYAGTFLWATWEWYVAAESDATTLGTLHPGLTAALKAIASTQQSDGLTWATPAYQVKYLMDQAEAYVGLLAAVPIAGTLGDTAMQTQATQMASEMATGIASMWNSTAGLYARAKLSDGSLDTTSWGTLYPDALAQAWIVGLGDEIFQGKVVPAMRASTLMSTFLTSWPTWDAPATVVDAGDAGQPLGYWPVVGFALANVGLPATAHAGWASIRAASLAVNRAYPFVTMNAGQLIILETLAP